MTTPYTPRVYYKGQDAEAAETQAEADALVAQGYKAGEALASPNPVANVSDAQIPAGIARDTEVSTAIAGAAITDAQVAATVARDAEVAAAVRLNGTTAARPAPGTLGAGRMYFDTTLNRPVWVNAAATGYVDSAGTAV